MANVTQEYREAVKIIEGMLKIKSWVNDNLMVALEIKEKLLKDNKTSPTLRSKIADDIIKIHTLFFTEQGGTVDKDLMYKKKNTDEDKADESTPFLSLKFTGTED